MRPDEKDKPSPLRRAILFGRWGFLLMHYASIHRLPLFVLLASCALYARFVWSGLSTFHGSVFGAAPIVSQQWPAIYSLFFSISNATAGIVLVATLLYLPIRQRSFLAVTALAISMHALLGIATYASAWIDGIALAQSPVAWWLPLVLLVLAGLNVFACLHHPEAGKAQPGAGPTPALGAADRGRPE